MGSCPRQLVVIADDLGIGPETDRGMLELARRGVLGGVALLVNGPTAESSARSMLKAGIPCDLGWHPCLTLDKPVLSPSQVPSLVGPKGLFHPLGIFLSRWLAGWISIPEVCREWRAQLDKFRDLVGANPVFVNSHQHVGIFPGISEIFLEILGSLGYRPWVRRVVESSETRRNIRSAATKRWFLCRYGERQSRFLDRNGYPGAQHLIGLANPGDLKSSRFFERWLESCDGSLIELMCHPGHRDDSLIGRDITRAGSALMRRVWEYQALSSGQFLKVVSDQGFEMARPSDFIGRRAMAC